jgi:hypothetical protein
MSVTYPGRYAVPGAMQPGKAVPGVPSGITPPVITGYEYLGYETLVCMNYTPSNGGCLVLVPGQVYQITAPALFQLRGHPYFDKTDFAAV